MKIAILLLLIVSCSKESVQSYIFENHSDNKNIEVEKSLDSLNKEEKEENIEVMKENQESDLSLKSQKEKVEEQDPLDFDENDIKDLAKYKTKNGKQYVVHLGSFQIEYFADRLLIKADSAGISDKITKFTYHKAGKIYHKITLGTFDSKEAAEEAVSKMKKEAPELLSKIIEI